MRQTHCDRVTARRGRGCPNKSMVTGEVEAEKVGLKSRAKREVRVRFPRVMYIRTATREGDREGEKERERRLRASLSSSASTRVPISFQTPGSQMEYAPPISKANRATHRVSVNGV